MISLPRNICKKSHNPRRLSELTLLVLMTLNSSYVLADERESLEQLRATTTNLIELLVQEGVLNKDKADALVKKAQQDAANQIKQQKSDKEVAEFIQDEKSVRVQYVPEHVKKEMREDVEKEVMAKLNYKAGERLAMPSWLDRITISGDLRLRYQHDAFGSNNAPIAVLNNTFRNLNVTNSSEDRDRLRVRARLGVDAQVNDWLKAGLRFTTGLFTTPVTPNQTEGIAQGKYQFGLDAAYIEAKPFDWLKIDGGRFANPFLHTDLVWDPDLAFDGFAATFTPKINDKLTSFTTIGAFPIEEVQSSEVNDAKDKWLYAAQTGVQWNFNKKSKVKLGVAYYDYENVEGQSNPTGLDTFSGTVPAFRQRGNNTFDINQLNGGLPSSANTIALASQFDLINVTGQVDLLTFDPVHITLTGDYVKNIGFDAKEIFKRTGIKYEEETEGYQVRLDIGHNNFNAPSSTEVKAKDWQVSLAYKRLEADAVLDALTDSNFRIGGTDAKGWLLWGNYALDKNAWLGARYFTADAISGPDFSVDVFFIDFNTKF